MKTTLFGLGLAAVAASVNGVNYDIASCAEIADIDSSDATSITITSTPIECDSYTRFRVRNDLVLKSDSAVVFSNFGLKVQGSLTVEPDVTFQGVTFEWTDGGVLKVEKDATATFLGKASFLQNTVLGDLALGEGMRNGGAIFNKGELVFEGDATFVENQVRTPESTDTGRGGAIYNARVGTITFNGELTANNNNANGFFEGQGGAIFNAGEIVVGGLSSFTENEASDGAAIFVHKTGTMTFNAFSSYTENTARDFQGGAIASFGSLNLLGGSLFLSNFADGSGDGGLGGGIYNGGEGLLTFEGDSTFDDNWGYKGGAIYTGVDATIAFPEDGGEVIFQNLRGEFCFGIFYEQESRDDDIVCGP